jgi:prolyl oligopeptidase
MKTSIAFHVRYHWRTLAAGFLLFAGLFASGWTTATEASSLAQTAEQVRQYPAARTTDTTDTFHGVVVPDPYRWMEDLGSAELDAWIQAQNRLSAPRLSADPAFAAIRARLARLDGLNPDRAPGRERGSRTFYLVWVDNAAQLMVQERGATAPRVLLDAAALGAGNQIKAFDPSPDGRRVAYVVGRAGADWNEIRIRDVASNQNLPEVLPNVRFQGPMEWTADGAGLIYRRFAPPRDGRLEAPAGDSALYLHRLGTPVGQDQRLFAPGGDRRDWSLAFNLPGQRRQLFIYVERGPWGDGNLGGSRAQVLLMDLERDGRPRGGAAPRELTQPDAGYRVLHAEAGHALMFTDRDAPRRRVVSVDLARSEPSRWRNVIPQGEGVINEARWFGGRLVVHSVENVRSVARVFDRVGRHVHDIRLPGAGVVQAMLGDGASSRVHLLFSGLLQAPVILDHDLRNGVTGAGEASPEAPDLTAFEVRQEWFRSKDGTRVPMFIVARRGLPRNGGNPTILYAYGASNSSELPTFNVEAAAWVQMGGVYVIASVRGGGEFGRAWYEAAIRERKQTSFDDLIAASEHLIAQGWTRPERLAISGASNGGLLVSATMLQRPDLFGLVLADVPVTDAMRRHLSGNGPQQVGQWGTPDDPLVFPALRAYSPVHNVVPGRCYPATLITTARDDQRMPPWHSYKFAAALQAAQGCSAPILLHVRGSGGHGGGGVGEWLDDLAGRLAFAARQLGLGASAGAPARR